MNGNILEVTALEKFFGGVHVTRNVHFAMQEGEQSAIIGPNGAGKSTFMNLLTGYHRPDGGKVVFAGRDITGLPPHKVVRRGISRAFQVSSIFSRMTVSENVRAALQAQMRATFRLFASARARRRRNWPASRGCCSWGEIILRGTPEEVLADETAQNVYLGEHHL